VSEHTDAIDAHPRDHPTESVLAAFLDGTLGAPERAGVEAHLECCTECRQALADAVEVLDASEVEPSAPSVPTSTRRRRRVPVLAIGMALAASIAGVAVLRRAPQSAGDVELGTRNATPSALDERIPLLPVIAPVNGAERVNEHPTFTWRSTRADRYSFRLLSEEGAVVWSRETTDTTIVLPADVRLERGRSYFWRVDALAAGIVASARAQRFTVSP
jgi:hypothetical protein